MNTRKVLSVAALVMLLSLCGCSSVDLVSQLNPSFSGSPFHNVLVIAEFQNLAGRAEAEENFCSQITDATKAKCVKSYQLFFAGERHTHKEIQAKIQQLGIDAVLKIFPAGAAMVKSSQKKTYLETPLASRRYKELMGII